MKNYTWTVSIPQRYDTTTSTDVTTVVTWRFNSSKVRYDFKASHSIWIGKRRFQFLKGTIRHLKEELNGHWYPEGFQFLKGTIRRIDKKSKNYEYNPFQFLKGTIRLDLKSAVLFELASFQFLKGTIRLFQSVTKKTEDTGRFNSSKVRYDYNGQIVSRTLSIAFQFLKGTIRLQQVDESLPAEWLVSIPQRYDTTGQWYADYDILKSFNSSKVRYDIHASLHRGILNQFQFLKGTIRLLGNCLKICPRAGFNSSKVRYDFMNQIKIETMNRVSIPQRYDTTYSLDDWRDTNSLFQFLKGTIRLEEKEGLEGSIFCFNSSKVRYDKIIWRGTK